MKPIAFVAAAIAAFAICGTHSARADQTSLYPFVPFGVYQPYGARFGASMKTPPYFSVSPPVYYGARHSRPYGMSPFAAPPMVSAPQGYHGRMRAGFDEPVFETPPAQTHMAPPVCGSCCESVYRPAAVKHGLVQMNPFMTETQVAKK